MNKQKLLYFLNIFLVIIICFLSYFSYSLYSQNKDLKNNNNKIVLKNKEQQEFIKGTSKGLKEAINKNKVKQQKSSAQEQLNVNNATYEETALAIIYYATNYDRQDWHSLIDAMNHNSELVITLVKSPNNILHKGQNVAYYLNTNTRSQGSCFYTIGKNNTIYFYSGLKKEYVGKATKEEIFDYVSSKNLVDKISLLSKNVNLYDFRNQTNN